MTYNVLFHPEAEKELHSLNGRVKILVLKQIKKICNNPEYGDDLGNKHGFNLTGYRKMYVDNKKIRIIYKFDKNEILIKIIAIGNRQELEVYKNADKRTH